MKVANMRRLLILVFIASGCVVALAQQNGAVLPFHSQVVYGAEGLQQVPVPAGQCQMALPQGLSYLWLSKISGRATSTHLGRGPYYIEICIFGIPNGSGNKPPDNGTPIGWNVQVQEWTAANGDKLRGTGYLLGITSDNPPKFIEKLILLDGGTGRFAYAEGEGTAIIDAVNGVAVYDGWIRYGKKQK